jgi:hypothetical protein
MFAMGFLIVWSRRPDAILNPQFFAEDGALFYRDAYHLGLHSVFLTYGGYFHTLLRLTALLAQAFPFSWAPLVMTLVGITVQVLPVNVFLSSRFSSVPLAIRLLGSFVYLALPNSFEIDANATNLQWHQALLSCLLLLGEPAISRGWRTFDAVTLLLTSLSSPMRILLLPVAALRWWTRLEAWSAASLGFILPGAVIQAISVLLHWHMRQVPHWNLAGEPVYSGGPTGASFHYFVAITGRQVFFSALLGLKTQYPVLHIASRFAIELSFAAIGFGFLLYAARRAPVELKLFILFASSVLALGLINPLAGPPTLPQWLCLSAPGIGNRYYFLPMLAFLGCLTWAVNRSSSPVFIRYFATALLLLLPIGIYRDWSYPRFRDFHFQKFANEFEHASPGTRFVLPVNPDWLMELTKH